MLLARHYADTGLLWSVDSRALPTGIDLRFLLALRQDMMLDLLRNAQGPAVTSVALQAPVDSGQEVWGSGVTYMRSREAREAESASADVYAKVYDAERPEIFFKAQGWRARGHGQTVRIRKDTTWNVPEPELTLVLNASGEIVGYTVGNDMSSRDIEGENPLYLPQAKTYDGSCAVGPAIRICDQADLADLAVAMHIDRQGTTVFEDKTSTANMKRTFPELARFLFCELAFPHGVLLMTGTGIVPPDEFTLAAGDIITIRIGDLKLSNQVA